MINVLENCNYSFYLDGEKIFKNFVTNKILKGNVSKEIYVNKDSIDIKTSDDFSNTEFKQVYLVYPKNEKFNKHIKIECDELTCGEYAIKLVPYSLRSTLR